MLTKFMGQTTSMCDFCRWSFRIPLLLRCSALAQSSPWGITQSATEPLVARFLVSKLFLVITNTQAKGTRQMTLSSAISWLNFTHFEPNVTAWHATRRVLHGCAWLET